MTYIDTPKDSDSRIQLVILDSDRFIENNILNISPPIKNKKKSYNMEVLNTEEAFNENIKKKINHHRKSASITISKVEVTSDKSNELCLRKDAYGNIIKKGNKKIKVTFKDKMNKPLLEIIEIQCIKKYNDDSSTSNNTNCQCACIIF